MKIKIDENLIKNKIYNELEESIELVNKKFLEFNIKSKDYKFISEKEIEKILEKEELPFRIKFRKGWNYICECDEENLNNFKINSPIIETFPILEYNKFEFLFELNLYFIKNFNGKWYNMLCKTLPIEYVSDFQYEFKFVKEIDWKNIRFSIARFLFKEKCFEIKDKEIMT